MKYIVILLAFLFSNCGCAYGLTIGIPGDSNLDNKVNRNDVVRYNECKGAIYPEIEQFNARDFIILHVDPVAALQTVWGTDNLDADFNNSGLVDADDMNLMVNIMQYGMQFNPDVCFARCDFNLDGITDGLDQDYLVQNMGFDGTINFDKHVRWFWVWEETSNFKNKDLARVNLVAKR